MSDHLKESASQTAGPYVHIGCTPNFAGIEGVYDADPGRVMRHDGHRGEAITITGRVFDGTGAPLRDAMVEIWQADSEGRFAGRDGADPMFTGWGRAPCDLGTGEFRFDTVKPGPVPFRDGRMMAPHVLIWIVARGINLGLHTRMYFKGEALNATDPMLTRIEHQARVPTLLAQPHGDGLWRFDIRLQGEDETIFFDM